jgi:hypothetical protein
MNFGGGLMNAAALRQLRAMPAIGIFGWGGLSAGRRWKVKTSGCKLNEVPVTASATVGSRKLLMASGYANERGGAFIMLDEDLPYKIVRINCHDEVIARAANLLIGRAAYETARRMYPRTALINDVARV